MVTIGSDPIGLVRDARVVVLVDTCAGCMGKSKIAEVELFYQLPNYAYSWLTGHWI